MPTVLVVGPYRFFFYMGDRNEPPHIHVRRGDSEAKFWLNQVRLHRNWGFSRNELRDIERLVVEHQQRLLGEWHERFNQ